MRATASGLDGRDFAAAELIQSVPWTAPAVATDAMKEAHKQAEAAQANRMAFPQGRRQKRVDVTNGGAGGGIPAPPVLSLSAHDPSGMSPTAPMLPGRHDRDQGTVEVSVVEFCSCVCCELDESVEPPGYWVLVVVEVETCETRLDRPMKNQAASPMSTRIAMIATTLTPEPPLSCCGDMESSRSRSIPIEVGHCPPRAEPETHGSPGFDGHHRLGLVQEVAPFDRIDHAMRDHTA